MSKTIEECHKDYLDALEAYVAAEKEASHASLRETDALNKLNGAQKALDAAFDAVKKSSPRSSDWKRNSDRMTARSA